MSDIQEEQKRLYKRAEENDIKLLQEEIKKILDIIKKVSKAEVNSYNGLIETPPMKWEILLDYITNLQEENERLIAKNLELETLCDTYEEEHKTTFEEWKKDINIIDELEKYIKTEAKVELYGDKTGFRTFADVNDILNKLNELKGDNK